MTLKWLKSGGGETPKGKKLPKKVKKKSGKKR